MAEFEKTGFKTPEEADAMTSKFVYHIDPKHLKVGIQPSISLEQWNKAFRKEYRRFKVKYYG